MKVVYFLTLFLSLGVLYNNCAPLHPDGSGDSSSSLGAGAYTVIEGAPVLSNLEPAAFKVNTEIAFFIDGEAVPSTIDQVVYEWVNQVDCNMKTQANFVLVFSCAVVQEGDIRVSIFYPGVTKPDVYVVPFSILGEGGGGGSALDGKALFQENCASCHGPLATTDLKGRSTVENVTEAIESNLGGMGSLQNLIFVEIEAIVKELQ